MEQPSFPSPDQKDCTNVTSAPISYRLLHDALGSDDDPCMLFARAVRRTVQGFVPHAVYAAAAAASVPVPLRQVARELALEANPLAALFAQAGGADSLRQRWNGFNATARLGVRTHIEAIAVVRRTAGDGRGAALRAELIAACIEALNDAAALAAPRADLRQGWHEAQGGGVPAELLALLYGEPGRPLAEAARGLGCAPRTVQRALARLGLTYDVLRQAVRLTIAGRLLRDGTVTVTAAAHVAGFYDAAHLNRAWRMACDITPLRYRALARL